MENNLNTIDNQVPIVGESEQLQKQNKQLKRTLGLLSILLLIAIISTVYLFLNQNNLLSQQIIDHPEKNLTETNTSSLQPSPITEVSEGNTETIFFEAMKFGDSRDTKSYQITYPKVTDATYHTIEGYGVTISDVTYNQNATYQLKIHFPTDGGLTNFTQIPPNKIIATTQFGDLYKISNPYKYWDNQTPTDQNKEYVTYTNLYEEECPQFSSNSLACGLLHIDYQDPAIPTEKISLSIRCEAENIESVNHCDEIISAIKIQGVQKLN